MDSVNEVGFFLHPVITPDLVLCVGRTTKEEKKGTRAGTRTRTLRMTLSTRNLGVRCLNPLGHAGYFHFAQFSGLSFRH